MWRKWRNEGDKECKDVAKNEAHQATNNAENNGFKEELEHDMAGACADGFADADFACAFGDGYKHDIHDADAADDERDASNEREHAGDNREKRASWMEVVGTGNNLVILVAFFGFGKLFVDGFDGALNLVGGFSADIDLLDLDRRFEGAGEIDINETGIVEIDTVEVDRVV